MKMSGVCYWSGIVDRVGRKVQEEWENIVRMWDCREESEICKEVRVAECLKERKKVGNEQAKEFFKRD